MKTRILAAVVAAAFIFTQCGLGMASPIYKEGNRNLRPDNAGEPSNASGKEITVALAGGDALAPVETNTIGQVQKHFVEELTKFIDGLELGKQSYVREGEYCGVSVDPAHFSGQLYNVSVKVWRKRFMGDFYSGPVLNLMESSTNTLPDRLVKSITVAYKDPQSDPLKWSLARLSNAVVDETLERIDLNQKHYFELVGAPASGNADEMKIKIDEIDSRLANLDKYIREIDTSKYPTGEMYERAQRDRKRLIKEREELKMQKGDLEFRLRALAAGLSTEASMRGDAAAVANVIGMYGDDIKKVLKDLSGRNVDIGVVYSPDRPYSHEKAPIYLGVIPKGSNVSLQTNAVNKFLTYFIGGTDPAGNKLTFIGVRYVGTLDEATQRKEEAEKEQKTISETATANMSVPPPAAETSLDMWSESSGPLGIQARRKATIEQALQQEQPEQVPAKMQVLLIGDGIDLRHIITLAADKTDILGKVDITILKEEEVTDEEIARHDLIIKNVGTGYQIIKAVTELDLTKTYTLPEIRPVIQSEMKSWL